MYSQSDLIGNKIDPTLDELVLTFTPEHLSDIKLLREGKRLKEDYGWIGEGYRKIFANQNIRQLIRAKGVHLKDITLTIDKGGVRGLEHVPEPERKVLEEILMSQYHRSNTLLTTVRNKDFERYDSVNWGVAEGLGFGVFIAGMLDAIGLRNAGTEIVSRVIPGISESTAIHHKVKTGNGARNHESGRVKWIKTTAYTLGSDIYHLLRGIPGGVYSAINVRNWADNARERILPEKINRSLERILGIDAYEVHTSDNSTDVWAKAQKSAPYRGAMALAAIRYFQLPVKGLYTMLESLAVFWTNSGNNAQGLAAVYNDEYRKLPDKSSSGHRKRLDAFKKTMSDPFQMANFIACTGWYLGVLALRSYGFRPEEHFGNLGAALEASLIGVDTAVAVEVAKQIVYRRVVSMPNLDISTPYLMHLARKYESDKLQKSLMHDIKNPSKFAFYASSRTLFGAIDAGRYAVRGVTDAGRYAAKKAAGTVGYVAGKAAKGLSYAVNAVRKYIPTNHR